PSFLIREEASGDDDDDDSTAEHDHGIGVDDEELPLILLHCTLLPPSLCLNPALPPPSEQALRASLPENTLQHWKMLEHTVMASGVLRDRGMLISHPEGDYAALECRIYDSLGLDGSLFDMRVYAANGLMREGAWRAAWREMEKIDVEICLDLSVERRRELEKAIIEETDRVSSTTVMGQPAKGDDALTSSRHRPTASPHQWAIHMIGDAKNGALIMLGLLVCYMAMLLHSSQAAVVSPAIAA
ncbi:hypothetical protein KEM52_001278, partial [Ascosphaera acerosa]